MALHAKKPSKSLKEFNGSSSTSFVNPIPIVAASVAGSHTPGFVISPTEDEMQEKLSDDARDFQAGSRNPSPRTQQVEHQPQYQRVVTVPRTLPQERISYGYAQNPHLQNFQLHGTAPPYPGKKLIFRPSTYAHPPRHFSHSPPDGMSYHHPPSPRIPPPHYQQIRNDAYPPPPRLLSRPSGQTPQSINHPHHHQPPPPRSQNCPQQPRHFYNNNRGSFPPTNFPSHRPNHFLPQPGSGFVNNNNYHHYLLPNKTLPPQVQYLQPPVPKPRKSLILRQNNDATSYENQGNNFPEQNGPRWIISSSEHHKLGPPHLIANQRHTSNSCVNLTSYGYTNGENEDVVIRKYSSQSRLSSCNSRSDFGSSSSIPWFRWFASRLEKEGQTKGLHSTETSVKSDGSNTHCIRCNKKLPTTSKGLKWMITAPVACSVCALKVCKTCAVWDQSKNSYSCGHCHPPKLLLRSIDKRKNFWFDNISLGVEPGTNFATAERDKVTENVREHLERIVESHVDEGIDAVSLARIFDHPQYDLVFHRFHEELSDALVNLSYSLKLAIENKPMPMNDTTSATSAHTVLTDLLGDIKEVTMELPLMEPMNKTEAAVVMSQNFAKSVQPSYEDLVATAVINKAITNGQKLRRKADSPMSLVDSAVQTDSEMSEGSDLQNSHRRQYKDVRGWVTNLEKTPHQQHPNISDDDLSMGTSSSNWSNEGNIKGNQQVVIEEQVEEITTTYESDSDISRHPPSRNKKGRKTARQRNSELANNTIIQDDTLLGDIDLNHFDSKVSFPEGGVDIIPRSKINADDNDEDAVEESAAGILVSQISEWEQNWLFKRRKQLLRRRNLMAEAVPMLVPNPNDDGIEPYIGDDKISDLSDLSDHVNDNDDNNNSDLDSSADEGEPSEIVEQEIVHNPVVDVALQMPPAAVKVLKPEENETISLNQQTAPLPQSSIITSKRASEAPHRLSNSSISSRDSASVGRSIELDMASRRSSSSSVSKSAAPKPKKIASRPIDSVKLVREPSDINVKVGKTARFECIVTEDSPEFSVAWFFGGHLISSSEGKSWVYSSGKDKHYLYIYDCQEKDAGKYDVSLFDFKGNETKVTYKLIVEGTQKNKPQPPNFTVLDDIIHTDKADSVVSIPFEITGHPEPYLQVFRNDVEISKLSHVLLEDKGAGQWNLDLRKKETDFPVFGEYVAVAKNSQGQTRVTFMIQETDGILNLEKKAIMKQEVVNSTPQRKSPEPTVPRPASLDSEDSSNGETMREQYHTLNRNQTMVREDYEAGLSESYRNTDPATMTVAEKEKLKWMNPVNLPNNPYAPENLAKRIRQRESNFHLPTSGSSGDIAATSSDDEKNPVMERKQNMSQFSRDYYVHGAPSQPSRLKSTTGPNFGSSRSLSLTSNSSREGSKEKESITSLEKHSNSDILGEKATISIVPSRSPVPQKRISQNGNASTTSNGKLATEKSTIEVATKKNFLGPERTPSPQVTTSRTPSPRPRRYNSDLGGSARREGVEPKVIQLPSVKRLAQQFQASDDKVQILEPKPSNGHQQHKAMFQPREQKSYQQPKPRRRPSDLALSASSNSVVRSPLVPISVARRVYNQDLTADDDFKTPTQPIVELVIPKQPTRTVPTKNKNVEPPQSPVKIYHTPEEIVDDTVDFTPEPKKIEELSTSHERADSGIGMTPTPEYHSVPVTPISNDDNLIKLDEEDDTNNAPPPLPVTPPPIPATPPPPRTPVSDAADNLIFLLESIKVEPLEVDDSLASYSFGESIGEEQIETPFESRPQFFIPSEDVVMVLPPVPTSFTPLMTPQSSVDILDFQIDATILENEEEFPVQTRTRRSIEEDSTNSDDLDIPKESNVSQPLYKAFNQIPPRNGQPANKKLANSLNSSLDEIDFVPRNPALKSVDLEKKAEVQRDKPSSNKTMNIVAQLEANQGTLDGSKTLPRMRTVDQDDFLNQVREKKAREEQERAQSLRLPSRRPTAMEVLSKPTPSMLNKDEEEQDLKKLRHSILRGARSGVGNKGNQLHGGIKSDQDAAVGQSSQSDC